MYGIKKKTPAVGQSTLNFSSSKKSSGSDRSGTILFFYGYAKLFVGSTLEFAKSGIPENALYGSHGYNDIVF
jgi:hypothetical protein